MLVIYWVALALTSGFLNFAKFFGTSIVLYIALISETGLRLVLIRVLIYGISLFLFGLAELSPPRCISWIWLIVLRFRYTPRLFLGLTNNNSCSGMVSFVVGMLVGS